MTPEGILSSFREAFGERIRNERTVERKVGTIEPRAVYDVWIEVERETLHDAVAHICRHFNPHLSVISGDDLGDRVAFNYHFATGWGERFGEVTDERAGEDRVLRSQGRGDPGRSEPVPSRGRDDPSVAEGPAGGDFQGSQADGEVGDAQ